MPANFKQIERAGVWPESPGLFPLAVLNPRGREAALFVIHRRVCPGVRMSVPKILSKKNITHNIIFHFDYHDRLEEKGFLIEFNCKC